MRIRRCVKEQLVVQPLARNIHDGQKHIRSVQGSDTGAQDPPSICSHSACTARPVHAVGSGDLSASTDEVYSAPKSGLARVLHDATVFRNGWARHRPLGALSVWRGSFFVVGIASHVSGYTLPPWTRNGMSRLSRELMTCTLPGELFARIAVQPSKKKYFVSRMGRNSNRASLVPYPQEGRFAIVTNVGLRDAVDARCVKTRRVDRARRSRVVLASRRRCQVGDDACASRRRR
jgi:hypothetical protein